MLWTMVKGWKHPGSPSVLLVAYALLAWPSLAQFGPRQTAFRNAVKGLTGTLDIRGEGSGTVSGPVGAMQYESHHHVTGTLNLDQFDPLTASYTGTLTGTITVSERSVISAVCTITNTYTASTSAQTDFRGAPIVWHLGFDIGSDTWSLWPSNDSVTGTVTSVQNCAGQQSTSSASNPLRFAPIDLKMGFPFPAAGYDLKGTQTEVCESCGNTGGTTVNYTFVYDLKANTGQTQVTIATNPPGLSITVDGAGFTAPQTFNWDPGSTHSVGATSPQGADTLYTFSSWSDGGARTHTITTPNSNTTYTAGFLAQYLLTGKASPPDGGTLTADPGAINSYYAPQTQVKVTAVPNCGFTFASFSGDLSGAANPQTVTMTAPRVVTAHFNPVTADCPPTITPDGILNGASNAKGQGAAAGGLVAIYGVNLAAQTAQADRIPLPTVLGSVSVTINGITAPLLFVAKGQINAQVPWSVPAGTVPVIVNNNGKPSSPGSVQVVGNSPGIFTVQFGVGQAIAINPDGTIAAPVGSIPGLTTHPAKRGDTIIVYATGLGAVSPAVADGSDSMDQLRSTVVTPTVLVGGVSAVVQFSGLSPQFVGVNQLNVVVPPNAPVGDKVPLQLQMGGITTTDQVTIAIQ